MRDNFTPVGLLLTLTNGGKKLNLSADVLLFRVGGRPVQQFHEKLFVAHKSNLAKSDLIASRSIIISNPYP